MKSVGHPSFDSTNFSGPVSPNLHPMYVVQAPTDSVWNPPEHVMPTPKVHDWSHDETLSPTQRQAVFRQRTLDAVGGDAPASSVPIIAIAFVTIFVGLVGTVAASVSHATGRPAGIRGAFWSLLKSRNTLGSDADSASPFGAMASVAVHTSTLDHSRDRGLTALPQPVPSSRTALFGFPDAVPAVPHSSSPTSSEGSAPLPAAYELGEDVEPCVGVPVVGASPSLDSAVEARHSRPDQGRPLPKLHVVRPNVSFMSGHHAKLLSMLGDVCPPTVLPTFAVSVERLGLASAGSELPDVDFALVDSQSAELIGCVVLAGPEHGALVDLLTQAGLCTVLLSPTELPERKTLLALVADLI